MDSELSGRAAIVTGASQGIGESIARVLAANGADVCLVARNAGNLERNAADITAKTGRKAIVVAADLMRPEAADAAVKAAVAAFGRLDILVNNAGATKRGDFLELTEADWDDGFSLKFRGAVRMTRAAWPHLKAAQGSVVNIIGIGSRTASAEFTIGGSVNSALVNFSKAMADRGRMEGVRVNAINPGHILTARLEKRIETAMANGKLGRDEAIKGMLAKLGINRFGTPEEIGDLVAYLVSPRAGFMLGSIIDIDGGETKAL